MNDAVLSLVHTGKVEATLGANHALLLESRMLPPGEVPEPTATALTGPVAPSGRLLETYEPSTWVP